MSCRIGSALPMRYVDGWRVKHLASRFSRWIMPAVFLFAAGCAATRTPAKEAQNLFDRGRVYARQGDNDLAIAYYNRGLELMPTFAWGYIFRGNAHRRKGHYEYAISDYTKAVELVPRLAVAYFYRGLAYHLKRDYDRAIADCTSTLALEPKFGLAHYNRAVAYYQIGDYARAWYDLHKAYQLGTQPDPEFVKKLRKATGTDA